MWKALLLCVFVISGFHISACDKCGVQQTNLFAGTSILLKDTTNKVPNLNKQARRATVMSAILPGLGQAYNRRYWKIPIIYGVAAGLGYLSLGSNKQYQTYKQALTYRYDDDTSTNDDFPDYTDDNLVLLKKQYKKRRDFCYIGIGAVYLLNIVDANVDAHLRGFNEKINENISLSVKPYSNVMMTFNQPVYHSGLKLKLSFK